MRLTRIHCPGPYAAGAELSLPPSGAQHLTRVLRLREGAALSVFDGEGQEFRAEISHIQGSAVQVRLTAALPTTSESPLQITLVQGVSRGERMDWTLQKATELGIAAIIPVITSRSVVRLDARQAQKKQEHWRAVVTSACEQCGRARIPTVAEPQTLREFLTTGRKEGLRLVLSPSAPASLAGLSSMPGRAQILIGPEGGLDDDEILAARDAGFMPVRLGPRVLRTETAAVVALSVLQGLWGDLQ